MYVYCDDDQGNRIAYLEIRPQGGTLFWYDSLGKYTSHKSIPLQDALKLCEESSIQILNDYTFNKLSYKKLRKLINTVSRNNKAHYLFKTANETYTLITNELESTLTH